MNKNLTDFWEQINKDFFDGELKPLADLGWEELSGRNGIGAHGKFFPHGPAIAIDKIFEFDIAKAQKGEPRELANFGMAYGLLVHEMIHQALHQRKSPNPGQHKEAFIAEASRLSELMGYPPVETEREAARWPFHIMSSEAPV